LNLRRRWVPNVLFRSMTGLRALRVSDPLGFFFLATRKTRAGLRLDCVSGVVGFYLQHSVSLRYRIRSSSPHARAINFHKGDKNHKYRPS
jgi:hypothetical protein